MAANNDLSSGIAIIILTAVFGCLVVIILFLWKGNSNRPVKEDESEKQAAESGNNITSDGKKSEQTSRNKKKTADRRWTDMKSTFNHKWLVSTLKGHAGSILAMDFSSNGKYLLSCSDDRCVMLWSCRDFTQKEHKSVKVNVEYDHATQAKWSPDSKAFIINQANGNRIQVYKVNKKTDGSLGNVSPVMEYPKHHDYDVISIGISCNGKYIMTCSNDTTIVIWSLKGEVLAVIDTHQVNNYFACVSPCGRFFASSGFTPDVKVWEVCFDKTGGDFKEVVRAFELKGHRAGIYSFAFNNDSSRMATVSKDGTWKLWDTKVEYDKGQEPYLLTTGETKMSNHCLIAITPDGRAVAIASNAKISCFCGITGQLEYEIQDVHTSAITSIYFSPDGKYLLSSGGRHIRIFHNVIGYRSSIKDLQQKKLDANNQTLRDRIEQQIQDARKSLETIEAARI